MRCGCGPSPGPGGREVPKNLSGCPGEEWGEMENSWDFTGVYCVLLGFHRILVGVYCDIMGFYGDFIGV